MATLIPDPNLRSPRQSIGNPNQFGLAPFSLTLNLAEAGRAIGRGHEHRHGPAVARGERHRLPENGASQTRRRFELKRHRRYRPGERQIPAGIGDGKLRAGGGQELGDLGGPGRGPGGVGVEDPEDVWTRLLIRTHRDRRGRFPPAFALGHLVVDAVVGRDGRCSPMASAKSGFSSRTKCRRNPPAVRFDPPSPALIRARLKHCGTPNLDP